MLQKLEKIIEEIKAYPSGGTEGSESFRLRFLSKKGLIPNLFKEFKDVADENKKLYGKGPWDEDLLWLSLLHSHNV